jgi:O-acetyl-ADP-ribose deacetylase
MERKIDQCTIRLVEGDITLQDTEAIVNAANSGLRGGGGVDGAIHRAGGPEIMKECRKIGGCPTGEARLTTAGQLPSRFVIHAVGPVYLDGSRGEARLLAGAYRFSLELAARNGIRTIAFPSISTGAYGYPLKEASRTAIRAVLDFLDANSILREVRFVLFGKEAYESYREALEELTRAG